MGKKTYGQLPGVTVQTSGGSVSDPMGKPGISLWGHSIILDGESDIECQLCDKSEDIPELLTMSSGFREVVYKMYVLGKFRKESCNSDPGKTKDSATLPPKNQGQSFGKPGNIYWSGNTKASNSDTVDKYIPQGTRMTMDGHKYIYHGDGTWRDADKNITLGTVDLIEKHGKQAKKKLPPEVVHEKQKMFDNRKKMMDATSLDTVGIGDLQNAGVDPTTSQSVDIKQDPDVDVDKSVAQKFAEKVQKGNHFLTR